MKNKIILNEVKYTHTEKIIDDSYKVFTIAITKRELKKHDIRFNPLSTPFIEIDGVSYHMRYSGLCTVKLPLGPTAIIGKTYKFGHWYYQNTLNVLDDDMQIIDLNESKHVKIF